MNNPITVQVVMPISVDKAWNAFTQPEHITQWNFAGDDWCCPSAKARMANDIGPIWPLR